MRKNLLNKLGRGIDKSFEKSFKTFITVFSRAYRRADTKADKRAVAKTIITSYYRKTFITVFEKAYRVSSTIVCRRAARRTLVLSLFPIVLAACDIGASQNGFGTPATPSKNNPPPPPVAKTLEVNVTNIDVRVRSEAFVVTWDNPVNTSVNITSYNLTAVAYAAKQGGEAVANITRTFPYQGNSINQNMIYDVNLTDMYYELYAIAVLANNLTTPRFSLSDERILLYSDLDGDGIPDDEDTDIDGDGFPNEANTTHVMDNCYLVRNNDQADLDNDTIGDACDTDTDGDGFPNEANSTHVVDLFPLNATAAGDHDNDTVDTLTDNCPRIRNTNQADLDGDGIGDPCDSDEDGDGVANIDDNCPTAPNPDQRDTDNDGPGDACDFLDDTDQDGTFDVFDVDYDGDGLIELRSAVELNMTRHSLDGSSLAGNSSGCPDPLLGGCRGYELIADLDLAELGHSWVPIGTNISGARVSFTADFDGNNHSIANIEIQTRGIGDHRATGLFAWAAHNEFSNLVLNNLSISDLSPRSESVGGLVGRLVNGSISNLAINQLDINTQASGVGGLVGNVVSNSDITDVTIQDASITSCQSIGGLAGIADTTNIRNVSLQASSLIADPDILECRSLGGYVRVGGLVGELELSSIENSIAKVDRIQAHSYIGGLVGTTRSFRPLRPNSLIISSSVAIVNTIHAKATSQSGAPIHAGGLVGEVIDQQLSVVASASFVFNITASKGGGNGGAIGIIQSPLQLRSVASIGHNISAVAAGGLIGSNEGQDTSIAYSLALTKSIRGFGPAVQSNPEIIRSGGLLGVDEDDVLGNPVNASVNASYWDRVITSFPVGESTFNQGANRTTAELTNSTVSDPAEPPDNIYKYWGGANAGWCDPATGVYSNQTAAPEGYSPVWDFGSGQEYPALNCLPIGLDEQRQLTSKILAGEPPLSD